MPQRQRLDQLHVRAAELIQREAIVHVRLAAHDRVELPVHQFRGQPLRFVELRGVELVELAQAAARQRDALQRPGARVRRQLLFQPILLRAAEIAGRRGEIGIAPDPLGGEVIEEASEVALRCAGATAGHATAHTHSRSQRLILFDSHRRSPNPFSCRSARVCGIAACGATHVCGYPLRGGARVAITLSRRWHAPRNHYGAD